MRNALRYVSFVLLAGAPLIASAAGVAAVDVDDATESLTNQIPSMTLILTTVLSLTAVVMAFRWIKRTMS